MADKTQVEFNLPQHPFKRWNYKRHKEFKNHSIMNTLALLFENDIKIDGESIKGNLISGGTIRICEIL